MAQATLQDVADRAGVHRATASRALNPTTNALVSAPTRRRVEAAAHALGYRANSAARMLRTRRSHQIGVLVPDILNPLYAGIARGAEAGLAEAGYTALILNTDNDRARGRQALHTVLDRQVDGLLLGHAFHDDAEVEDLVGRGVPLVLVLREVAGVSASLVTVDERYGTSLAVRHLVGLGHRRIAHITGPQDISTSRARLRAFIEVSREQGCSTEYVHECESYSLEAGELAADWFDALVEPPTAVVAGNDLLALGLIAGLERRGLVCPDDVSVVGYNDMPLADRFAPPLTTVRVPQHDLGFEAARVLLRQLVHDDRQALRVELLPELIVRGSTAAPAG